MMQERSAKIKAAMEASVAARKAQGNVTAAAGSDTASPSVTATVDMQDALKKVAGKEEEGDGVWLQESSVASWDERDVLASREESSSSGGGDGVGAGGDVTEGGDAAGVSSSVSSNGVGQAEGKGIGGEGRVGGGEGEAGVRQEQKEREVVKISLADAMKEADERAAARRAAQASSSSSGNGVGVGDSSSAAASSASSVAISSTGDSSSLFDPSLFEDWTKSSSSSIEAVVSLSGTSSSSSSSGGASGVSREAGLAAASSSSNGKSSSPSSSRDRAGEEQLVLLLEDMLRSPEGHEVVKRFMSQSVKFREVDGSGEEEMGGSSSGASGVEEERSETPRDTAGYIDSLLSDPETKAMLVRELEERLFEMSQQQQGRGGSQKSSKDD